MAKATSANDRKVAGTQAVEVIIRMRPGLNGSSTNPVTLADDSRSVVASGTRFHYDWIAPESSSQLDIFNRIGARVVSAALSGTDACVFAYGATGSGKTHTMLGALSEVNEQRGLLPRIVQDLVAKMRELELTEAGTTGEISCSALEVYNESLLDLLSHDDSSRLIIRDRADGVHVDGLTERVVSSAGEAISVLQGALAQRRSASTLLNARSSRSHAICTVRVTITSPARSCITRARIHLVDLAGSERQKKSGTQGEQLKEAASINRSLLNLGTVMRARAEGHVHVSYRSSKLTHVLKDALEHAQATLIATVANEASARDESLATLQFAQRVTLVRTSPVSSITAHTASPDKAWPRALLAELTRVREESAIGEAAWQRLCAALSDAWLVAAVEGKEGGGEGTLSARVEQAWRSFRTLSLTRDADVRELERKLSDAREEAQRVQELLSEENALDKLELARVTQALAQAEGEFASARLAWSYEAERFRADANALRVRVGELGEEMARQAKRHAEERREVEARLVAASADSRAETHAQREQERLAASKDRELERARDEMEELRRELSEAKAERERLREECESLRAHAALASPPPAPAHATPLSPAPLTPLAKKVHAMLSPHTRERGKLTKRTARAHTSEQSAPSPAPRDSSADSAAREAAREPAPAREPSPAPRELRVVAQRLSALLAEEGECASESELECSLPRLVVLCDDVARVFAERRVEVKAVRKELARVREREQREEKENEQEGCRTPARSLMLHRAVQQ